MRVGSFFLILLVALILLGYLLSDSMHLREDLSNQQREIERLSVILEQTDLEKRYALEALQHAEQERQNTVTTLQNVGQELGVCQQKLTESKEVISQLTSENVFLQGQNQTLASSQENGVPTQPKTRMVQSGFVGLVVLVAAGFSSVMILGLGAPGRQKPTRVKGHSSNTGNYIYLTNEEIRTLIHWRRAAR